MMAGLFALIALAMLAVYFEKRALAIGLWALTVVLSLAMFCFHATDTLKINW